MKITRMYISLVKEVNSSHLATASVTFNNVITVHGISLFKSRKTDEFFIVFPYKKMNSGKNAEIYGHPLNTETREFIKAGMINGYETALKDPDEALVIDLDVKEDYELSDARITPFDGEGKTKAYATITFNNCFLLRGLKVILKKDAEEGSKDIEDYFVAMPRRLIKKTGKVKNVYNPVDTDFYHELSDDVLKEFAKVCF